MLASFGLEMKIFKMTMKFDFFSNVKMMLFNGWSSLSACFHLVSIAIEIHAVIILKTVENRSF